MYWLSGTNNPTIGLCMFFGASLISCECKRQKIVSKSSIEAEYRSVSSASSKVIWLQQLLRELGVFLIIPTPLYANTTSAILISTDLVFHEWTKHTEVDCQFIRRHVISGAIHPHTSSEHQLADLFIKVMTRNHHDFLASKLMLCQTLYQF